MALGWLRSLLRVELTHSSVRSHLTGKYGNAVFGRVAWYDDWRGESSTTNTRLFLDRDGREHWQYWRRSSWQERSAGSGANRDDVWVFTSKGSILEELLIAETRDLASLRGRVSDLEEEMGELRESASKSVTKKKTGK